MLLVSERDYPDQHDPPPDYVLRSSTSLHTLRMPDGGGPLQHFTSGTRVRLHLSDPAARSIPSPAAATAATHASQQRRRRSALSAGTPDQLPQQLAWGVDFVGVEALSSTDTSAAGTSDAFSLPRSIPRAAAVSANGRPLVNGKPVLKQQASAAVAAIAEAVPSGAVTGALSMVVFIVDMCGKGGGPVGTPAVSDGQKGARRGHDTAVDPVQKFASGCNGAIPKQMRLTPALQS